MILGQRHIAFVLLASSVLATGCGIAKKKSGSPADEHEASSPPGPSPGLPDDCGDKECGSLAFTPTLSTGSLFETFATKTNQLGVGGQSVKFMVDARQEDGKKFYFINGNHRVNGELPESAKLHYHFAREFMQIPEPPVDYNQVTYFSNEKRYYAGTIQRYHLEATNEDVYGVQFFPQDVIAEAMVVRALKEVKSAFRVPDAKLAFVATGLQQTTATVSGEIQNLGYRILTIDALLGGISFLPMNLGEAWGYLRIFPPSQDDLRPTDIPVFDELPLDLAVVASTITRAYQDPNSHVNLKSRERGTPNFVFRKAALDSPELKDHKDKPIHLIVTRDGFEIQPSTDEEVRAKLAERLSKPWLAMPWTADERLMTYDEMCAAFDPSQCLALRGAYGGKSVGLGFLAHAYVLGRADQSGSLSQQLGYDLSPRGFAIPFAYYDRFINDPENAVIKEKIAALIAAEEGGDVSPADRRKLSDEIRAHILTGKIAPDVQTALNGRLLEVLPGIQKVKVRSSANAEDSTGFNGAGLYDSFKVVASATDDSSVCVVQNKLNKFGAIRAAVLPATFECGIKAAWASLWNPRAVAERSFARLSHRDAVMGLSVVSAYSNDDKVSANSVIVTHVSGETTLSGYSVSSNKGNNLVTNPAPETWSELATVLLFGNEVPASITITRYAKSKVDKPVRDTPVMDRAETLTMVEVAKTVEAAYCRAIPSYYTTTFPLRSCEYAVWDKDKPKALDFELKLLKNGHVVMKQVREFSGSR